MKRLILGLFGIVFWTCSGGDVNISIPSKYTGIYDINQRMEIYKLWLHADPTFSDDMVSLPDTLKYLPLVSPNMEITDLLTGEEIINVYDSENPSDKNKFALYTINWWRGTRQLFIVNKGKFKVIYVDDYSKAIKEVISYFERNKDVDARLLPFCIQEITRLYVGNRRTNDDHGPWRRWWGDEADSLGRIYNSQLNY